MSEYDHSSTVVAPTYDVPIVEAPTVVAGPVDLMADPPRRSWGVRLALGVLRFGVPLVVIAAAGLGAAQLIRTAPRAGQNPPEPHASLVQIDTVRFGAERVAVEAMGTVIAAQQVVLQSRVSGQIVEFSPMFIPGGHVRAGDVLLTIERRDYELAVVQARSAVAQAEYEVQLEQGHQDIAKREWELLGIGADASELDQALALRKPHLAKALASLAAGRAKLEQAELDLERTVVRAPFNGVVTTKHVDLGAQVTTQTQLATLVGADEYWVRVSVPVDRLGWVTIPDQDRHSGSPARIVQRLGAGVTSVWHGKVIRLLGDLESQGRMARLIVAVPDPLKSDAAGGTTLPLLIGSYVDVSIEGQELRDVVTVDRSAIRDGENAWIMDAENKLEIRPVEVAFRGRERVIVREGLRPGDRLVVSDLATPVVGMPLRISTPAPTTTPPTPAADGEAVAVQAAEGAKS